MGNMEGQNPPTMADTIECESYLISMKEHEIAALKAEVERLKEKYTEVLEENRSLRKANLSFGPAQIKLQNDVARLAAELMEANHENERLKAWILKIKEYARSISVIVVRYCEDALKGGKQYVCQQYGRSESTDNGGYDETD